MIKVTLHLRTDTRISFSCPTSGPLFDQISQLVAGFGQHKTNGPQILQLVIEEHSGTRGIALAPKNVLGVETVPANAFNNSSTTNVAQTAPYIRIPDFLPSAVQLDILEFSLSNETNFANSSVKSTHDDQNIRDKEARNSMVLRETSGLPAQFEQDLRALVPDVMSVLEIEAPNELEFEIQLTAHNDGAFYKMHRDNNTPTTAARQLTFVYYFNQTPKMFDGGQIRLFDTMRHDGAPAGTFLDIEPENNSIIFFPSHIPHEVLEVLCPSKQFANSRFTLNGWVRFKPN